MSNKLERFTQRARRVLSLAQEEAKRMHHAYIGTEHLLLGMIEEEGGVAGKVLRDLGAKPLQIRKLVEHLTGAKRSASGAKIDLASGTKRVLELAVDEARRMGHHYVGTEHLLLGIARQHEGVAIDILKKLGISSELIRRQTRRVLQETRVQLTPLDQDSEPLTSQIVQRTVVRWDALGRGRKTIHNLAFIGVGNVGRALIGLLHRKREELGQHYGIHWRITGVASRRLGWLVNPDGFDVEALLAGDYRSPLTASDIRPWLKAINAHVLFENSSMNPQTGQPAIDYIKAALEAGAHVITANKGPVVHAYHELRDLAKAKGKQFLFEATVMGGAPIFSLFREALPAANLKRFRGILNSTTNLILTEMENGLTFDAAVKKAQDLGIAETDPSADVDGWDAAVKVSALATVLMDVPVKPQDVNPQGIRALTPGMVSAARAAGKPYKLVCQVERGDDGKVTASVRPEQVALTDPLASVRGASSIIQFQMDTLYGLTLSEQDPDAVTTAYGPLADFITIAKSNR